MKVRLIKSRWIDVSGEALARYLPLLSHATAIYWQPITVSAEVLPTLREVHFIQLGSTFIDNGCSTLVFKVRCYVDSDAKNKYATIRLKFMWCKQKLKCTRTPIMSSSSNSMEEINFYRNIIGGRSTVSRTVKNDRFCPSTTSHETQNSIFFFTVT